MSKAYVIEDEDKATLADWIRCYGYHFLKSEDQRRLWLKDYTDDQIYAALEQLKAESAKGVWWSKR